MDGNAVNGELPVLQMPRQIAIERIRAQIAKGNEVKSLVLNSHEQLDEARKARQRWRAYTRDLLRQLVSRPELAEEFDSETYIGYFGENTFGDATRNFAREMDELLNRLNSILERMELFPVSGQRADGVSRAVPPLATNRVFVVHGREPASYESVCRLLVRLDLDPVVLHEQPSQGRTIIEKFEDYAQCGFAVVLLTPDDVGHLAGRPEEARPRARQNVILELGYFLGKLGRAHVCALHRANVEVPSDYQGVVFVSLDEADWRTKLAKEMKQAGMDVDMNKLA